MISRTTRAWLIVLGVLGSLGLAACGQANTLSVQRLASEAQQYNGKQITVDGFYLKGGEDPGASLLAPVISTLDNGLNARPNGDLVWVDGFPEPVLGQLHQPGDATYGLVRLTGQFETGGRYGTDGKYTHRIQVTNAESIERIQRREVRIENKPLGDGKIGLLDLVGNAATYNGTSVTTQGYYFWNGVIFVLAEGVSTEQDGSSPQPIGKIIWMEGFPPDESGKLHLGPGTPPGYVWGLVEVTGDFKSGGQFGREGKYTEFLQATSAKALENVQP